MFNVPDCFEYDGVCPGLLAAVRCMVGGGPQSSQLGAQSRSCPAGSGSLNLETIQNTSDTTLHYSITTLQQFNVTTLQQYNITAWSGN